jgi:hypothetical protein
VTNTHPGGCTDGAEEEEEDREEEAGCAEGEAEDLQKEVEVTLSSGRNGRLGDSPGRFAFVRFPTCR